MTVKKEEQKEKICIASDEVGEYLKSVDCASLYSMSEPRIVTAKTIAWKKALLDEFNQEKPNCETR